MPKQRLKLYYSVSEVAQMFDVSESLLRFWEREFPNIKPHRAGRGVRQYTEDDIQEVRLVYQLVKERGMTLQGARDALKRGRKGVETHTAVIDRLTAVRDELQALSKELEAMAPLQQPSANP